MLTEIFDAALLTTSSARNEFRRNNLRDVWQNHDGIVDLQFLMSAHCVSPHRIIVEQILKKRDGDSTTPSLL